MNLFQQFFTVAAIHLLAVMSPGPDFVMISRNSLVYSRRTGVYSAMGLGLGILVHVAYSIVGIGLLISKSIVLFTAIKYFGAAYLMYIGYKCLRAKPQPVVAEVVTTKDDLGALAAARMGFLTNVLNPKATLFFLALFTQVIDPATPVAVRVLYGAEMSVATFAWFACVALLLSQPLIKRRFAAVQHHVERVFGSVLVAFGIKVALSSRT